MTKIAIVLGTRPEIIKLSQVIRLSKRREICVIFSGQHYDYNLGLKFIDELGLPEPDFKMEVRRENPAKQTGDFIQKLSDIFLSTKPDAVILQGDTNTVLGSAIAALKCKIDVCHVEAGLRSFDWRMPEEHNRIMTDHISELLFAPTEISKQNLLNERVHGKIFVVGNTVIDAVEQNAVLAQKKSTIKIDGDFILLTLHRAENVDDKKILANILESIIKSGENFVFPVHPRTLKNIHKFSLYDKIRNSGNITMINAVGYLDMLYLMQRCRFIVSDSGGLQEEATSPKIRKKVLIVRRTTDRPEAVKAGFAELVGTNPSSILHAIRKNSLNPRYPRSTNIYGDGRASQKIIKIIRKTYL